MRISQVIRSIKTSTFDWSVVSDNANRIVMSNNNGVYFIRYCNFGGFKIICPSEKIEMNYLEDDVVATQLWMYLVDVYISR